MFIKENILILAKMRKGEFVGCYKDGVERAMNDTYVYHLGSASNVEVCIDICGPQGICYTHVLQANESYLIKSICIYHRLNNIMPMVQTLNLSLNYRN